MPTKGNTMPSIHFKNQLNGTAHSGVPNSINNENGRKMAMATRHTLMIAGGHFTSTKSGTPNSWKYWNAIRNAVDRTMERTVLLRKTSQTKTKKTC